MQRRIVIAGTGSGVGKTTLTIGLMAALKRKGYVVQGFKCGPDYIDPTYHTSVTGRVSRNVDSWMFNEQMVKEIYCHGSEGADISIIEGVMGLFDGKNPCTNEGSTAEISHILKAPVILVVNCSGMARSAAAVVKGFQSFSEDVVIAGVIVNKVGSIGHYKLVKEAIEFECGIPTVGYLRSEDEIQIPERQLGLVPSIARGELEPFFERLADLVSETVDIDQIVELSACPSISVESSLFLSRVTEHVTTIAVARDAAFHFYYPENLEILEAFGARLVYFSPLAGETVPQEADGLYIGGGFPEEFAEQLSTQEAVKESIRMAVISGLPTLAECGGYMYLTESITDSSGNIYPMVGLIPGSVRMQDRLAALGYRTIKGTEANFLLGPEDTAKGHEYHYSTYHSPENTIIPHAYETSGMRGLKHEGYVRNHLVAGYTHIHFASCPELVKGWIEKCIQTSKDRQ